MVKKVIEIIGTVHLMPLVGVYGGLVAECQPSGQVLALLILVTVGIFDIKLLKDKVIN